MGFGKWIAETFGGSAKEIIEGVGNVADTFIHTKEDKEKFKLALMDAEMKMKRLEMEAEAEYTKDRQNARAMYMKDSSLQKVFAIVFLIFYCLISGGMIAMVIAMAFFAAEIVLPDWGVMLISSVFTAMSTKVSTITDFLFGGSKEKDDSEKRIAEAFSSTNVQNPSNIN